MASAICLAATDHDEFITLVPGKQLSLLMAGNNDEVYDMTPTTALCSCKSEASVTIIKDSARVILLRLTTDGHKASCGLSARAELLVNYMHF